MKIVFILFFNLILVWTDAVPLQEFTKGNTLFAAAVYKEILKNGEKNILVSPLSAEIVLALTQSGAKGQTAEQIRSGLHLPDTDEKTKSALKTLLPSLKASESYSLNTANKIYVRENYGIKEEFKRIANKVYQADLENINFSQNTKAADTINSWVEKQTENKIHDLIDPNSLSASTALILINALHFKARWTKTFSKFSIKKTSFYKTTKDIIQVDTMFNLDRYNYHESTELNAKFLELPFQGQDVSFVIVLPNDKEGLAALEAQAEKVFSPPDFKWEAVEVALTKFKIESKIDFKKILQHLGVSKAFTSEADLSGIAGEKGELTISEVIQKTFIDVDEEGVEAAAATFVGVNDSSGPYYSNPPKQFIADHPFIFYIKIKNLIVFEGRVSVPN